VRQVVVGRDIGRFWNRSDPFIHSQAGPLVGYFDPLLALSKGKSQLGIFPNEPTIAVSEWDEHLAIVHWHGC